MASKEITERYKTYFLEIERLYKFNKISMGFFILLNDVLVSCLMKELYNKASVITKFNMTIVLSDKAIAHIKLMKANGDITSETADALCLVLKKYRVLSSSSSAFDDFKTSQESAADIIWSEIEFYKNPGGASFKEKVAFNRGNKDKYPYFNGVIPESIKVDSIPYPVYGWYIDGKFRIAGETLLHLFDMPTRPTKRAQFNAVIGLCQDHGGNVVSPSFYEECANFFNGSSDPHRVYCYIRYTADKMRNANTQLYKSIVGTSFDTPTNEFIEKSPFKISELQRSIS